MLAQLDKKYIKTRPLKVWNRLVSYGLFEGRPVTTKGQWINPIVFSIFKLWNILPQLKKVKHPVFIIGTGRSGTTLLGIVLSMHKQISFLNEPKALWHAIYKKEDIIGSYSEGAASYTLSEKEVNDKIKKRAHRLFGAYLTLSGGERVFDKYPELMFRIPFVKEIFPDAKFLFITRNGVDTLQSIDKWSERLGKETQEETHDWWGVGDRKWKLLCSQVVSQSNLLKENVEEITKFTNHKHRATVEWIVTMEQGLQVLEQYPEAIFSFKYEDFLAAPTAVLQKIMDFTGLRQDDKMLTYGKEVIGKPAPKKEVDIHPILETAFFKLMRSLDYAKEKI